MKKYYNKEAIQLCKKHFKGIVKRYIGNSLKYKKAIT